MKYSLLFIVFIVILSSCEDQSVVEESPREVLKSIEGSPGVVPPGLEPYSIFELRREHSTWKELDEFYGNVVLPLDDNVAFKDNLKSMTIALLALEDDYAFWKDASLEIQMFYLEELLSIDYVPPQLFIGYMTGLKNNNIDIDYQSIMIDAVSKYNNYIDNEVSNIEVRPLMKDHVKKIIKFKDEFDNS